MSDTQNPVWREDLLLFERQRHKEIQREAAKVAASGDAVAIAKLDNELKDSSWLKAPP